MIFYKETEDSYEKHNLIEFHGFNETALLRIKLIWLTTFYVK
jgi:hypothetical protein